MPRLEKAGSQVLGGRRPIYCTRREELLLPEHTLHKIHMIRRGLAGHRPVEAMERLLFFLRKFPNNPQMLLEIKA